MLHVAACMKFILNILTLNIFLKFKCLDKVQNVDFEHSSKIDIL